MLRVPPATLLSCLCALNHTRGGANSEVERPARQLTALQCPRPWLSGNWCEMWVASLCVHVPSLHHYCCPCRRLEQNNPQKYVQQVLGPLYSALTNDSGSQLYVGIWGNSDFNDISQWLQVRFLVMALLLEPACKTLYRRDAD